MLNRASPEIRRQNYLHVLSQESYTFFPTNTHFVHISTALHIPNTLLRLVGLDGVHYRIYMTYKRCPGGLGASVKLNGDPHGYTRPDYSGECENQHGRGARGTRGRGLGAGAEIQVSLAAISTKG